MTDKTELQRRGWGPPTHGARLVSSERTPLFGLLITQRWWKGPCHGWRGGVGYEIEEVAGKKTSRFVRWCRCLLRSEPATSPFMDLRVWLSRECNDSALCSGVCCWCLLLSMADPKLLFPLMKQTTDAEAPLDAESKKEDLNYHFTWCPDQVRWQRQEENLVHGAVYQGQSKECVYHMCGKIIARSKLQGYHTKFLNMDGHQKRSRNSLNFLVDGGTWFNLSHKTSRNRSTPACSSTSTFGYSPLIHRLSTPTSNTPASCKLKQNREGRSKRRRKFHPTIYTTRDIHWDPMVFALTISLFYTTRIFFQDFFSTFNYAL